MIAIKRKIFVVAQGTKDGISTGTRQISRYFFVSPVNRLGTHAGQFNLSRISIRDAITYIGTRTYLTPRREREGGGGIQARQGIAQLTSFN